MQSTLEKSNAETSPAGLRSKAPVFVLGCPRSGTTLLSHMLFSAGNFAIYRTESNVFSVLQPRFGDFARESNRRELLRYWLRSKLFRETGLDAQYISDKIVRECRSAGDFLRVVMEEMARRQSVERWADATPDHLLYIPEIKRQIPNALVVHIIRDGRDVALSYIKQSWAHPLPWDKKDELCMTGLFWEWIVRKGRESGKALGADYCELRFEDLIERPRETLAGIGQFIQQDLDYDRIQQVGIGSVSQPNSSFDSDPGAGFTRRWAGKMTPQQLADFEALTGEFLRDLGYPLAAESQKRSLRLLRLRYTYPVWFETRQWLKNKTPLGRFTKLGRMGLSDPDAAGYSP
jgi:Sulfotransferase family